MAFLLLHNYTDFIAFLLLHNYTDFIYLIITGKYEIYKINLKETENGRL